MTRNYLNYAATAAHFEVSVSTVRSWLKNGTLPERDVVVGGARHGGWYPETLLNWEKTNEPFKSALVKARRHQVAILRSLQQREQRLSTLSHN